MNSPGRHPRGREEGRKGGRQASFSWPTLKSTPYCNRLPPSLRQSSLVRPVYLSFVLQLQERRYVEGLAGTHTIDVLFTIEPTIMVRNTGARCLRPPGPGGGSPPLRRLCLRRASPRGTLISIRAVEMKGDSPMDVTRLESFE
jgi:hypothetical protein